MISICSIDTIITPILQIREWRLAQFSNLPKVYPVSKLQGCRGPNLLNHYTQLYLEHLLGLHPYIPADQPRSLCLARNPVCSAFVGHKKTRQNGVTPGSLSLYSVRCYELFRARESLVSGWHRWWPCFYSPVSASGCLRRCKAER